VTRLQALFPVLFVLAAAHLTGCAWLGQHPSETAQVLTLATNALAQLPAQDPDPKPPAVPDALTADQAEWERIEWHTSDGPALRSAISVGELRVGISGGRFHHDWTKPLPIFGADGDAAAYGCFFVRSGDHWKGGKYEWIRAPGQVFKEPKNILKSYNRLPVPAKGAPCAMAWVSYDGRSRTTLATFSWPGWEAEGKQE